MKVISIYISRLKKNFFSLTFLFFTLFLVVFSKSNLSATKYGLDLFINNVVPSLLPFFIATEMLTNTNIVNHIGILLNPIMKPLFNVSGQGAFAFTMGIISGYPIGAKIACEFRKNNICSKEECERLLSFTNNSGPLFIIGTVGISMFGNSTIGILLFITHILSSITVGIIFRFWRYKHNTPMETSSLNNNYKEINLSNLGEVISKSINNSISTILTIGGFIVLFSCIISILNTSKITNIIVYLLTPIFNIINIDTSFIYGLFTGIFEITNGICYISNINIKTISINIIFSAFLLGFGGISIMLQVLSIISKTDLSKKPYIIGKLLHGIIASFYTYVLVNFIPFLSFNLN